MSTCTCVLCDRDENDRLKQQLAAERAKVALATKAFEELKTQQMEPGAWAVKCIDDHNSIIEDALTVLRTPHDVLAAIRREVARECAEIADRIAVGGSAHIRGASKVADAIRAKFGVTE